jgi:hypothetical protein
MPSARVVRGVIALAMLAAAVAPRRARADDDPPFTIGTRPAWLVMGGLTAGGTVEFHDRGGFVGGELSVARLHEGDYVGVYGDAYRDFGMDGTYVTGGLELGRRFLGIDGGAVVRFADGGRQLGVTGRVFVSVGLLSIFVRYAHVDADGDPDVVQVGATLKFPLHSPM